MLCALCKCIRGNVSVRMELVLRFDYGRTVPWVTGINDGVRAVAGRISLFCTRRFPSMAKT